MTKDLTKEDQEPQDRIQFRGTIIFQFFVPKAIPRFQNEDDRVICRPQRWRRESELGWSLHDDEFLCRLYYLSKKLAFDH